MGFEGCKRGAIGLLAAALFSGGCGSRDEVRTYETPAPAEASCPACAGMRREATSFRDEAGVAFSAQLPEGWREVPASGIRARSYEIEGTELDVYLTILRVGELAPNVNRWRGQVGLPPATPESIEASAESFLVAGRPCRYVEILREGDAPGVLAAIVRVGPAEYRYVTAKGSSGELRRHAGELRSFLDSVSF